MSRQEIRDTQLAGMSATTMGTHSLNVDTLDRVIAFSQPPRCAICQRSTTAGAGNVGTDTSTRGNDRTWGDSKLCGDGSGGEGTCSTMAGDEVGGAGAVHSCRHCGGVAWCDIHKAEVLRTHYPDGCAGTRAFRDMQRCVSYFCYSRRYIGSVTLNIIHFYCEDISILNI